MAANARAAPETPAGAHAPGWSAVHADSANSDYHSLPGAADIAHAWSRTFEGMINLGPTSDGHGRVYVTTGGEGCRLHALDRATGETLWCSDALDRYAVSSSPLIDAQGDLYVADGTAMHSFDRNGKSRWSSPILGAPLSAQLTPQGDLMFITHVGVIYLLDRATGRQVLAPHALVPDPAFDPAKGARACMRGLPECPSANTPAIDLATGRFFFTFWTPGAPAAGVRAMRVVAGAPPRLEAEWTNDNLPGGSASSPTLSADGRRLYVTDNAGGLHALDAATGRVVWSVAVGYAAGGSVSVSPQGLIMPAGGREAALLAVEDRGDAGVVVWKDARLRNLGIATQAAGLVAYPTVAAASGQADLVVVDTRSGEVLDREPIPGRPLFTVGTTLDRDGTVYVPSIRGELHAFRPAGMR